MFVPSRLAALQDTVSSCRDVSHDPSRSVLPLPHRRRCSGHQGPLQPGQPLEQFLVPLHLHLDPLEDGQQVYDERPGYLRKPLDDNIVMT